MIGVLALESNVNIPVKNLACSIDELIAAINQRWEKAMPAED